MGGQWFSFVGWERGGGEKKGELVKKEEEGRGNKKKERVGGAEGGERRRNGCNCLCDYCLQRRLWVLTSIVWKRRRKWKYCPLTTPGSLQCRYTRARVY